MSLGRVISEKRDEKIKRFISKKCSVKLTGWNDGIFDSYLLKQDKDFLYYLIPEKKKIITGMLTKKYIIEIELSNEKDKYNIDLSKYININREFFAHKKVDINLNDKHIWSGIIGKDTEFLDVVISSFSSENITIEEENLIDDKVIKLAEISKIEVSER